MANPQCEDGFVRIANALYEALMVSGLTGRQRRAVDLIIRLSYGCGRKDAIIPRQKDFELAVVGEGHIRRLLADLQERQVITRQGDRYALNKDFEQWRVGHSSREVTAKRLTELVSLNLQNLPKGEVKTYRIGKKQLTEKVSLADTNSDTPKDSIKDKVKTYTAARMDENGNILFLSYFTEGELATFRERKPGIDLGLEAMKASVYWTGSRRKCKNPKLAFVNWVERARPSPLQPARPVDPLAAYSKYNVLSTEDSAIRSKDDK